MRMELEVAASGARVVEVFWGDPDAVIVGGIDAVVRWPSR
jgi:hypothetical protein